MNNVYSESMNEWVGYKNKVFQHPWSLELLSNSLHETHYGDDLSEEMQQFFQYLNDNVPKINGESYSKQALANVTIIRHRAKNNDNKTMLLGCKNCQRITDALCFASSQVDDQQEALNILKEFFMPYRPQVRSLGGENVSRKLYWQKYWQSQVPQALPSSTGSTTASSTGSTTASSVSSSSERPQFVDWQPVATAGPIDEYDCFWNRCRLQRSVVEPQLPLGNISSPSDEEEDLGMYLGS